ncbi:hypothetical protein V3N99_16985 [Dermatophilaceae bacterium Soc4.6]
MSPRRKPALRTTRRWTAGALLAAALVTGGVGVHLEQTATTASTTVAVGSSAGTTTSGFAATDAVAPAAGAVSTTTTGS